MHHLFPMSNRKSNNRKSLKLIKYLPIIFLCTITCPSNYSGQPLNLRNGLPSPFPTQISEFKQSNSKTTKAAVPDPAADEYPKDAHVTGLFVLISILCLIIATICLSLILGYLHGVSTVKECVLLYLYRDVVTLVLLLNWWWSATVVTVYARGNGITLDTYEAKVISYCGVSLCLLFLLAMNFMAALRFYMKKEMILDPKMPWGDDDDFGAATKIRLASIVLVFFFVSTMYASEAYPKAFYIFVGDDKDNSEVRTGSLIFLGVLVSLMITYAIASIATKFYQQADNLGISRKFPRRLNLLTCAIVLVFAIMMIFGLSMGVFENGRVWIKLQLIQILIGILTPAFIILTATPLKSYLHKNLTKSAAFLTDLFYDNVGLTISLGNCRQRSSQIEPVV